MSYKTSIEWTDSTWNPIIGCTKVSSGCKNCYAEAFSERFRGVKGHPFELGFSLRLLPKKLDQPLHWKNPRKVFVCSMSDLFHEQVPLDFIQKVFEIMAKANNHIFQILTKRTDRLQEISPKLDWTHNIWVGVSIESHEYLYRIQPLRKIPVVVRFISFEPLLGPIPEVPLDGIDWVIVGGESGRKSRKLDLDWVKQLRDQCLNTRTPFFFKQIGGKRGKGGGELAKLDGVYWHDFPTLNYSRCLD